MLRTFQNGYSLVLLLAEERKMDGHEVNSEERIPNQQS